MILPCLDSCSLARILSRSLLDKILGDAFRGVFGSGCFGGVYRTWFSDFCSINSDSISRAEAELVRIWEKVRCWISGYGRSGSFACGMSGTSSRLNRVFQDVGFVSSFYPVVESPYSQDE